MGRIEGYYDFTTADALVGWIANLDQPDTLEDIVCVGEGGDRLTFQPFIPRRDVCDALNVNGRFGFAIPLAALERFGGGSVRLATRYGAALTQGNLVELPPAPMPRPAPRPTQAPTWIVLHIQKTAGTSLRVALTGASRPGEALFLYPDGFSGVSPAELAALPLAQRAALRLVIGHAPFGIGDLVPGPAEYITFLREPGARLRSHYLHHLALGEPALVDGARFTVPQIVSHGLTDEFDNLMVRMVAGVGTDTVPLGTVGEADVERALHNIRTRFRFVGLVERMAAHYDTLCSVMGIPHTQLTTENTCRVQRTDKALSQVDWTQVLHRNRFDTMLYEGVRGEGLCGRDLHAARQAGTMPPAGPS